MSLVEELKSADGFDFAVALVCFLGVLAPGFLTLFLFRPELVITLDTLKVLLFSASLTLPVTGALIVLRHKRTPREHIGVELAVSVSATALIFFPGLLSTYLFHLSFRAFLGFIAAMLGMEALDTARRYLRARKA